MSQTVECRLDKLVLKLVSKGAHTQTLGGQGMDRAAYCELWPEAVEVPSEYAGRFEELLLVDRTIAPIALVRLGGIDLWTPLEQCADLTDPPTSPTTGKALSRYVAFCQFGKCRAGQTVENCRRSFAEKEEAGLTTIEGLQIPLQYKVRRHEHGIVLAGSRCGLLHAPYLDQYRNSKPHFSMCDITERIMGLGSASRGKKVIPVSEFS